MGAALGATERIAWLDVAKGFSILGVVIFHAHLYALSYDFAPLFSGPVNAFLQPIRMPLFFTISGLLAAGAIGRPWGDLLSRKVWALVYLFALWGLIRWGFFGQVLENVREPREGDDWLQLLSIWINPSGAMWYIWALAIFCVVAKMANGFKVVALLAALALACLTWGGVIPATANSYRLGTYLVFFLAGAYLGPRLVAILPARPWAMGAAALVAYVALEYWVLPALQDGIEIGVLRFLQSMIGVVVGCAVAVLLSRLPPAAAALGHIGRHTLPVYVTHVIVVIILAHSLRDFAGQETWRYAIVPLLVAVSLAAPLLLEAALNRVGFPWLYRAPNLPSAQRRKSAEAAE